MSEPSAVVRGGDAEPRPSGTSGGRRRRSRRGEGELLRDEILDAAEELLIEHGTMEAVSIRMIADAVGVSPPALYLHFADKDELFFALCQRQFADFAKALEAACEGIEDDPAECLRRMARAYIRYGIERVETYELLFGSKSQDLIEGRDLSDSPGHRALQLVVDTIGRGIASGDFRDDLDPLNAAFALWSGVHGAVMIVLVKGGLSDSGVPMPEVAPLIDAVCDVVLNGLAVR